MSWLDCCPGVLPALKVCPKRSLSNWAGHRNNGTKLGWSLSNRDIFSTLERMSMEFTSLSLSKAVGGKQSIILVGCHRLKGLLLSLC